jgi:hypothetical protein
VNSRALIGQQRVAYSQNERGRGCHINPECLAAGRRRFGIRFILN